MGIWDKLKNEFIDIIEWLDDSNDTLVYRFPRYNQEIKNNAKLTVREGQAAVFVNEGQVADVFGPGMYTLNTQNLPILSTLKGWKYGFNSPFKAEVYFVITRIFTDQKWGTGQAIMLSDDRFGMIDIQAYGTYSYKIEKPGKFIKEIVGTDGHFTQDELSGQLRSLIVTRFTDAVGESKIPIELFAAQLTELSDFAHQVMRLEFMEYGLELTKMLIESISMPEEIKKEIYDYSRLNKIDLNKLAQFKAAQAMEAAAKNQGAAGAGVGMGMGFAMANQMGQMFNQTQNTSPQQSQQPVAGSSPTPPPLPQQSQFFVAVNGQQTGPFDMNAITGKIQAGELSKETLVWKQGMSNWEPAGSVSDLTEQFGTTPPPIPGN
ncbi:MAG: SPFH domain-containing protein [Cyclobacteriaceae bacterium]